MVAMPADVVCDACGSRVSGCLWACKGSMMVSNFLCITCTWLSMGRVVQSSYFAAGGLSTPGEPGTSILVTVVPAAAQYPEGAKRLTGIDREYIVAPLMSIIEEAYTVYLDFQHPSTDVNHQALAPGQRPVHEE